MCNKAYGTPNPSPTDNPSECRANTCTLEQGKKAISDFLIMRTEDGRTKQFGSSFKRNA